MRFPTTRLAFSAALPLLTLACIPHDEVLFFNITPPLVADWPHRVQVDPDQVYGEAGGQTLRFDLFRPLDMPGPFPLIIVMHGGAWNSGSREGIDDFAYDIAAHGYAAASIDYRLADGATVVFPQPVADVITAVQYLRDNADTLNLDPRRVGMFGISAGAHLSLMAGLTTDTSQFDSSLPPGESLNVKAIVEIEAPTDFTVDPSQTSSDQNDAVQNLLGVTLAHADPQLLLKASPVSYVHPGSPPVLVIHGDADQVVPIAQARILVQALSSIGQQVQYDEVPGMDHIPGALWTGPYVQAYRGIIFDFLAASM